MAGPASVAVDVTGVGVLAEGEEDALEAAAEAFGEEHPVVPAQELVAGVAEHAFRGGVDAEDGAVLGDHQEGVRAGFQHRLDAGRRVWGSCHAATAERM